MRGAPVFLPFLLLLSVANTACVLVNAEVNPGYITNPSQKSRLETLQPMIITLLVDDQRSEEERDYVGQRRNGYGGISAKVFSGKPVTSIFHDALLAELQNNGHAVSAEPSNANRRTIKVGVKRFWTENRMNFFDITMSATAYADVVVQNAKKEATLVKRSITGTAEESRQFAGEGAYQDALNIALQEFVRSFARDSEIIKALREPTESP